MVLGLGDTGLSMARWLRRRGAIVSVADTRAAPPHAATLARELPEPLRFWAKKSQNTFLKPAICGLLTSKPAWKNLGHLPTHP